jgi:hypothetical protein
VKSGELRHELGSLVENQPLCGKVQRTEKGEPLTEVRTIHIRFGPEPGAVSAWCEDTGEELKCSVTMLDPEPGVLERLVRWFRARRESR